MTVALTPDEEPRLKALVRYAILDTPPESGYDVITALAARLFRSPIARLCFVDRDREWCKSSLGIERAGSPREGSFSDHVILRKENTVVPDARRDPRFASIALAAGPPGIRFYAGAPVVTPDGFPIGVLSVADTQAAGVPENGAIELLADLAALVCDRLEIRLAGCRGRSVEHLMRRLRRMEAVAETAGKTVHDLNSMMTVIIGQSDLILNGLPPDHQFHRNVEDIATAGDRAREQLRILGKLAATRLLS